MSRPDAPKCGSCFKFCVAIAVVHPRARLNSSFYWGLWHPRPPEYWGGYAPKNPQKSAFGLQGTCGACRVYNGVTWYAWYTVEYHIMI